ncbi:large ribosomal subunit protein bL32m isoform X2 [Desmodus rotundus]|uniref:large ribosomal subunit protein bL32m isoform X2 n=1 Tax=Desmodus rotundus TaxID=9430 RepID=UPI001E1C1D55|nr:39S ribosomal protein L32, mitochondrial isoform X2 [Desmodus rotundus]
MLVLVVPQRPMARLLANWWELLQRKFLETRPDLLSPPWGPALALQGSTIFIEPANNTNGSKEISSLLDSIFWMAAPKNRRSIEVNRCRRRNPQKLIKVKVFILGPTCSCSDVYEACTSQAFCHYPSSSWFLSGSTATPTLCIQQCWAGQQWWST